MGAPSIISPCSLSTAESIAFRAREGGLLPDFTLHFLYTTAVIISDYYSKGWLGSGEGTFITSEVDVDAESQHAENTPRVSPGRHLDCPTVWLTVTTLCCAVVKVGVESSL